MLVLVRKRRQSIMIGKDIKITILSVRDLKKGYFRIGISAPTEIEVHREEVFLRNIARSKTSEVLNKT